MVQDMFKKTIESENPLEHWNDVQNVGQTVLDLGCGWISVHLTTPEYWMQRGATKVIGVDITKDEIDKLNDKYPQHEFVCFEITKTEDLKKLLDIYKPDFLKMDIEGYETVLENLQSLGTVKEIAIEYHDANCKRIVFEALDRLGFLVFALNKFGYHCLDENIMGVVHAKKW
jgi:ubiquinone/menaquinone biosynthesis C-methylase UbiE